MKVSSAHEHGARLIKANDPTAQSEEEEHADYVSGPQLMEDDITGRRQPFSEKIIRN